MTYQIGNGHRLKLLIFLGRTSLNCFTIILLTHFLDLLFQSLQCEWWAILAHLQFQRNKKNGNNILVANLYIFIVYCFKSQTHILVAFFDATAVIKINNGNMEGFTYQFIIHAIAMNMIKFEFSIIQKSWVSKQTSPAKTSS